MAGVQKTTTGKGKGSQSRKTSGNHRKSASSLRSRSIRKPRVSKPKAASSRRSDPTRITETPQRIGRFKVLEEVGRGGMGVVYLAIDPENGETVAIKRIRSDRAHSQENVRRFIDETDTMAEFDHPNILQVIDRGTDNGLPYFVMHYVDGTSLDAYARESGGVEWALSAAYKIALALDHIHEKGWFHRDVKPSNILVDDTGEPFLTDFGICRSIGHVTEGEEDEYETAGTPLYMAPEQVLAAASADHRVDIYALGIIMYELFTGVRPYRGHGTEDVLSRILFWEPIPPRMLNPTLSAEIETVITKAMHKCSKRRHQTASELAHDLKALLVRAAIKRRLHSSETAVDLPAIKRN